MYPALLACSFCCRGGTLAFPGAILIRFNQLWNNRREIGLCRDKYCPFEIHVGLVLGGLLRAHPLVAVWAASSWCSSWLGWHSWVCCLGCLTLASADGHKIGNARINCANTSSLDVLHWHAHTQVVVKRSFLWIQVSFTHSACGHEQKLSLSREHCWNKREASVWVHVAICFLCSLLCCTVGNLLGKSKVLPAKKLHWNNCDEVCQHELCQMAASSD